MASGTTSARTVRTRRPASDVVIGVTRRSAYDSSVSDASTWASQANDPSSADVAASYRERREARAAQVAEYDRRHAHLAWWRFAIAAAAVGVLIWLGRPGIPWLLLAAPAFVAV